MALSLFCYSTFVTFSISLNCRYKSLILYVIFHGNDLIIYYNNVEEYLSLKLAWLAETDKVKTVQQ